jgi:hypothetical protein
MVPDARPRWLEMIRHSGLYQGGRPWKLEEADGERARLAGDNQGLGQNQSALAMQRRSNRAGLLDA